MAGCMCVSTLGFSCLVLLLSVTFVLTSVVDVLFLSRLLPLPKPRFKLSKSGYGPARNSTGFVGVGKQHKTRNC